MNQPNTFHSQFPLNSTTPRFEIWFTVIMDRILQKALWLRYTTFFSTLAGEEKSLVLVWASLFDAQTPTNHSYGVAQFVADDCYWEKDSYHYPTSSLSPNHLTGEVTLLNKQRLTWQIALEDKFEPIAHTPAWLARSGIPKTSSLICSPFAKANGNFIINNKSHSLTNADTVLTHIWGTYRVEELFWVFVPQFDDDEEGWGLEIVTVKASRQLPPLTFVVLKKGDKLYHDTSLWRAWRGKVAVNYPHLTFCGYTKNYTLEVHGKLNETQITPYLYRDPGGTPRYIDQSDLSQIRCVLRAKDEVKELRCNTFAAVEFHGMKPWRQVSYLDPF